MTNAILRGKPDAGNPHVRFDEGEVASAKPRRGSLLYKRLPKYTPAEVRNDPYGFTYKEMSEVIGENEAKALYEELYSRLCKMPVCREHRAA